MLKVKFPTYGSRFPWLVSVKANVFICYIFNYTRICSIDGIDYDELCTSFDYHPLWRTELENEGRDYAIGMRLPFYMHQLGLHDINVRMNDKVIFTYPQKSDYEKELHEFIHLNGYDKVSGIVENEKLIEFFMNRGINRVDAERFVMMRAKIAHHFSRADSKKSFLKVQGLMITYGTK